MSSTLVYPEASSAVARARRGNRLSVPRARTAGVVLEALVGAVELLEPTRELVWRAGALASAHGLSGYDAVHLSTAIEAGRHLVTVVTADARLAAAAAAEGLRVVVPAA